MNNLSSFLSYTLLFSFLLNVSSYQSRFDFFVSQDAATFAFQKHNDFHSVYAGFVTAVEEIEDSEQHNNDPSNADCYLRSGHCPSFISGHYYTDFLKTAFTFVQKEALYICYSSLKIPFSAIAA